MRNHAGRQPPFGHRAFRYSIDDKLTVPLGTLDIVKGGRHRASIVLNACMASRGVGEASSTKEARTALNAFGVPVAPVSIVQRAALSHALLGGLAISEAEPNGKATKEMRALWRYVEKELSK